MRYKVTVKIATSIQQYPSQRIFKIRCNIKKPVYYVIRLSKTVIILLSNQRPDIRPIVVVKLKNAEINTIIVIFVIIYESFNIAWDLRSGTRFNQ